MVTVKEVIKGSAAAKRGIIAGDIIISINGNQINDVLDYRFYITEKKLEILVHRGSELLTFRISKNEYDDIGLDFETFLMDKKHCCRNKCIFCFIDQNPKDMRETIYFKDDDSRLSFLMGNYVTLTNLAESDIERIIKMKMSPINISVHTTDEALRCEMLGNRFAGNALRYIGMLSDGGIAMNFQIVLCRDINDGAQLEKTLNDLAKYYPAAQSIAVVPAGLTKYRDGLYPLTQFTPDECKAVISAVNTFGDAFAKKEGVRLAYCSDEFYLRAGIVLPGEDYYDGYPQLDNGVGMLTSFSAEADAELEFVNEDYGSDRDISFSIATGNAAYPLIKKYTDKLAERFPSLKYNIYEIKNDFFGENITVAGLICGCDLIGQLRGKPLGGFLLIPSVMLRDEGDRFLDDITLHDAEEALGVPIKTNDSTAKDFFAKILGK